jgi:hypothetical protein
MLSRFLSLNSNASSEVSKTIMYLQRFGMGKDIKCFSPLNGIKIHSKIGPEIACEKIHLKECYDFEKMAHDFLLNNKKIQPILVSGNYLERFWDAKILYATLAILILFFWAVNLHIKNNKAMIASLKENIPLLIGNLELKINEGNFFLIKQFINTLKDSQYPLELLQKVSEIRRKHNISIEHLSWENEIKVKTSLTKKTLNKLKLEKDIKRIVQISNDEYEELGSDKKFGTILCIK